MTIRSNIILQAEAPPLKKDGFRDVLLTLNQIEERLDRLSGKNIVINITARIDDQTKRALSDLQGQTRSSVAGGVAGGVSGGAVGGGGARSGASGGIVGTGPGRIVPGASLEGGPLVEESRLFKERKEGGALLAREVEMQQRLNQGIQESVKHTKTRKEIKGEITESSTTEFKQVDLIGKAEQRAAVSTALRAKTLEENLKKSEKLKESFQNQGFDITRENTKLVTLKRSINFLDDEIIKINKDQATYVKETIVNKDAQKSLNKALEELKIRQSVAADKQRLLNEGFKEGVPRIKKFADGTKEITREFQRVSGSRFLGTQKLEISELNERTGKLNTRVLEGSVAARRLGDSFSSAAGKVTLWVTATTGIFGAIRTITSAVRITKELENNTIFLARVGRNIRGTFASQEAAAQNLTRELVELSSIFGVSATESQRAAGVFARQGQNQREILQSVTAAILASRIAELDLVEASELLASALAQFNLEARELLPTLNALNELSNNYRVTTDDLLQSISRTGAVFAEQGGTLEELAAATAVLVQNTARTGTQIGNALKTITSRVAGIENSRELFEKTGIAIRDTSGQAKSMIKVFLELEDAFQELTKSEKDQLSIRIAGIRQRNILLQAVNDAVDIAIAEAVALRDNKSAFREAQLEAGTLTAAVDRLKATFVELVSTQDFQTVFKDLVALLSGILKLIGAFDGLLLKVALISVSFLAVRVAVVKLVPSMVAVSTSSLAAAKSFFATSASANALRTSSLSLVPALNAVNIAAGVLTAGLFLLVSLIGKSERASAKAAAAQKVLSEQSEIAFEQERKQTKATENLVNLLFKKADALKEILELEKQGIDRTNERIKIEKDIQNILNRGLNIPISDVNNRVKLENALNDAIEKVRKERKEDISTAKETLSQRRSEVASIEKQISRTKELLSLLENPPTKNFGEEIAESLDVFGITDAGKRQQRIRELQESLELGERPLITIAAEEGDFDSEILETQAKLKSLTNEFNDGKKSIEEYISSLEELSKKQAFTPQQEKNARKAQAAFFETREEIERLGEGFKKVEKFDEVLGLDESEVLIVKSDALRKKIEQLQDQLAEIAPFGVKESIEEVDKSIKSLQDELRTTSDQLELIGSNTEKAFSTKAIERTIDLLNERDKQLARVTRELQGRTGFTSGLDELISETKSIRERIIALRESVIRQGAGRGGGVLGLGSDPFKAAQKEKILDLENDLSSKQVDIAKELLKVESDIALQRKKSADEAARALGVLSDEDKLRLRAQLSFFARKPGRKISLEEQFLAGSEGVRLAQQFFLGRLETQPQEGSRFGELLKRSGFGVNTEVSRATEELRDAKQRLFGNANISTEDIIKKTLETTAEVTARSINHPEVREALGKELGKGIASIFTDVRPVFNVNFEQNVTGMQRLVDAFERVVTADMVKIENRIISQVNRTLRELEKDRVPRVLPNPNP